MQWDHRPGTDKLFELSAGFARSRDEVRAEIAKCELVCTNCHTIRTVMRAEWGKKWLKEGSTPYGEMIA